MEVQGIHVEAILVRPETAEKGNPFTETTIRNDFLLSRFCKRLKEEVRYAPRMEGLLNRIKHRVSPSTIYRNTIEVAPNLAIKVWVYKKTSQQNLPSLRMYSDRAPPGDSTATRAVKAEREYKLATDPDVVVPPDQQVKAYRYGPQIVPLSEVDRAALEFHADKGVKVLGFTLCENIPRHYYMSDVSLFIPDPNDPRAATAISALARALKASDKVAIVRCKFQERQGLGVTMGVLTPNLSLEDGVSDSFYFNVLPFAEDIREFTFASFDEMPPQTQPTKTQVAAMDQLVSTLDLAPAGIVAEAFLPDTTPNPILQRYYKAVYQRVVNPDLAVPELDESLRGIVEPDVKKLFPLGASKAVEHVEASFTLKEPTGKKAKSSKRFMVDRMEEARNAKADEEDGDENGDAALMESTGVSAITMDAAASQPPGSSIGRADPVGDFNAMLNRQDDDRWVPKAIQEMKAIIHDYLDSSYKGSTYSRAMECLTALRKGCIIQQEPRMFNEYLPTLQTKCKGRLDDFWDRIVANKLSLINKEEAPDSDVTEEQAEAFLSGRTIEAEVEGYDDLLDEI